VGALGAAPSNPPGWKRSKGTKLSARCVAHLIFFPPFHPLFTIIPKKFIRFDKFYKPLYIILLYGV